MRSPCYECEFRNEDKNNERCQSCEKRIAYAQATQLISSETANGVEEIPRRAGKKRGRKPIGTSIDALGRSQVFIRFPSRHAKIHQDLVDIAELEHRTISMQAIHFLQEGIIKYYKENSNER